jgi:DNA-binding NarL/FixJ family response regulator
MALKRSNHLDERPWKVFIADNHPVVRTQLAALIERDAHLKICGESDAASALSLIRQYGPDLVILDVSSERSQGIDLLKQLQASCPNARVLALSLHDDRLQMERALQAGAAGYLTKQDAATHILPAIQSVMEGKVYANQPTMQ